MKLRQHKREHVKRLRRRIARRRAAELRAQWDTAWKGVGTAVADAMVESMRAQREFFRKAFASVATRMVSNAIRPGRSRLSPLRTVTAPAPGTGPLCGNRITQVWIDEMPCVLGTELQDGLRIETGANGQPVAHVDGSKAKLPRR